MSAESILDLRLREAHRRHIAAQLPLLGWVVTCGSCLWFALATLADAATVGAVVSAGAMLAILVAQGITFAAAAAWARRDPSAAHTTAVAVGACIVVGLAWVWILTTTATMVAMLTFGALTLFSTAPLVLAWTSGPQLAFQGGLTLAWIAAVLRLPHQLHLTEMMAAIGIGNVVALAASQWAVHAFRTEVLARFAALDFDRQIAASRDAYRMLAENAVDFIWSVDRAGRWTYVNDALARRCGLTPSAMIGRPATEILAPDDPNPDPVALLDDVAAGEPVAPRVFRMTTPDGACWVETRASATWAPDGTLLGAHGVSRDITERRATEEALRASEERFRSVFSNAPVGMALVDAGGVALQVNHALAAMLGYEDGALVGMCAWDVLHPDDVATVRALVEATLAGTRDGFSLECRHLHRDGHPVWNQMHVVLQRGNDGGTGHFISQIEDITEARAGKEALRSSERRFRSFAESMAAGVLIAGTDGMIYVNQAVSTITGFTHEELMQMQVWDLVHPDERGIARQNVMVRLDGGRLPARTGYRLATKSGEPRWVDITVAMLELDGAPVMLGTAFDVTERRLAEEALRSSEAKLRLLSQRQVAVRGEERKRLSIDLHDDVCQELVAVGILVESAVGRLGSPPPEAVSDLTRCSRYLREVVDHLRVLARDLRPLVLHDLGLESSLRSLALGLSNAETTVRAEFATEIPRLAEPAEVSVHRIAQEAVTNAVRHAHACNVTVTLAARGDRLQLEVRDDGCGFDVATREVTHALGLASMEERAQALAGRLTVESRRGVGTAIRLDCPLQARVGASAA